MDFLTIDNLAKKYGTPFYLMDVDKYLENVNSFCNAFKAKYDKIIVGYSFKTNYVPSLCRTAKEIGCYAEVVSEMEYALAKQIGFKNIILNGPIKKDTLLITALKDKSIINLDSIYELETILNYKALNPTDDIAIGLRINIDLTGEDGCSKIQNGLRVGRFGFSMPLLEKIIPMLRKNGIRIASLHGHTSSSDRAVANYKIITLQMLKTCEKFNLTDLQYFDVGGGFFGAAANGIDVSNKPKYIDYANAILDICLDNNWFLKTKPTIVIEPGASVVSNVFSYVSSIFQTKEIAGKRFLTTDGTVFDVKPTFHSLMLPHDFFVKGDYHNFYKADLVGSTCMEKDVILNDVDVPECIGYGDYVKINGVGAYTLSLTPIFINFLSPIIGMKGEKHFLARRRQTIEDVINIYKTDEI